MEGGALASPDVEEEFLWSCSLSGAGKVKAGPPCSVSIVDSFHQMFVWDPKECEDSAGNKGAVSSHRLLARGHHPGPRPSSTRWTSSRWRVKATTRSR